MNTLDGLVRATPMRVIAAVLGFWAAVFTLVFLLTGAPWQTWLLLVFWPGVLAAEWLRRKLIHVPVSPAPQHFRALLDGLKPQLVYRNPVTGDVFLRLSNGFSLTRQDVLVVTHVDDVLGGMVLEPGQLNQALTWRRYWVSPALDKVFSEPEGGVIGADAPGRRSPVAAVRESFARVRNVSHFEVADDDVDRLVASGADAVPFRLEPGL